MAMAAPSHRRMGSDDADLGGGDPARMDAGSGVADGESRLVRCHAPRGAGGAGRLAAAHGSAAEPLHAQWSCRTRCAKRPGGWRASWAAPARTLPFSTMRQWLQCRAAISPAGRGGRGAGADARLWRGAQYGALRYRIGGRPHDRGGGAVPQPGCGWSRRGAGSGDHAAHAACGARPHHLIQCTGAAAWTHDRGVPCAGGPGAGGWRAWAGAGGYRAGRRLGADWYVGNCHKWLCAPKGAAFIWAAPERQDGLHPVTISHGFGQGFLQEFDWTGTRDFSAYLAVPAALDFHARLGGAALRARNVALAAEATALIARRLNTEPGAAGALAGSMGMVRLPVGGEVSAERARSICARNCWTRRPTRRCTPRPAASGCGFRRTPTTSWRITRSWRRSPRGWRETKAAGTGETI